MTLGSLNLHKIFILFSKTADTDYNKMLINNYCISIIRYNEYLYIIQVIGLNLTS